MRIGDDDSNRSEVKKRLAHLEKFRRPTGEEVYASDPSTVIFPIIVHCALCYLQSSFAELAYTVIGDVPTILMMQSAFTIGVCPLLGRIPYFEEYYPRDYRLPFEYLKLFFIPNCAFAFQLLFKQLAIQSAGVGFGEIISGFSVLMAAWLQYIVLDIRLYGTCGFLALLFYALSLFSAYFVVGLQGLGIGVVQGSCSSVRTIFTRRINNKIIIKPGHHQFFTGCTNFIVMGTISIYVHCTKTFYDYQTGEQFYPVTRIFWPISLKQLSAAFADNILVFYLMQLLAPLTYHLQSQIESLMTMSLDFVGVTEYLGGRHKDIANWPTAGSYFFRMTGIFLYSYSKWQQKRLDDEKLVAPDLGEDKRDLLSERSEFVDRASVCTESSHGIYLPWRIPEGIGGDYRSSIGGRDEMRHLEAERLGGGRIVRKLTSSSRYDSFGALISRRWSTEPLSKPLIDTNNLNLDNYENREMRSSSR